MTNDEALEDVRALRKRLEDLASTAGDTPWRTDWDILRNDIEEFVMTAFGTDGKDYEIVHRALHPYSIASYPNKWLSFVHNYLDGTLRALELLEHRLEAGQARLRELVTQERLIPGETPHSAYVLLREIVEGASRRLWIVDPYLDRSLFPLLSNVQPPAEIRVLTRRQNLPADFVTELGLFTKQRGAPVEGRVGLDEFHDRCLVADDRLFFSGASFKDLGKKGSVVMEVKDIRDEVLAHLERMWNSASAI